MDEKQRRAFRKFLDVVFYMAVGALWAGVLKVIVGWENGVDFLVLTVIALVALIGILVI